MRPSKQTSGVIALPITDDDLTHLRFRYETAYVAYQDSVQALEQIWLDGETPSTQLLTHHAQALRNLNEERTRYRDALVQVAFLSDDGSS